MKVFGFWLVASIALFVGTASILLVGRNVLGVSSPRYVDELFTNVKITHDIEYTPTQMLDIYEPEGDTEVNRPLIIWIHGGGFVSGDKSVFAGSGLGAFGSNYARLGYVTASINYHLVSEEVSMTTGRSPRKAIALATKDAQAAIAYMRAHASEYRIDPNKIFVGGSSAGAVTSLYTAYQSGGVMGAISFSGGMLPEDVGLIGAGDPPAILIHGEKDTIVPLQLASSVDNALARVGIAHELVTYPTGHATRELEDAHTKVQAFLVSVMTGQTPVVTSGDGHDRTASPKTKSTFSTNNPFLRQLIASGRFTPEQIQKIFQRWRADR